MMRRFYLRDTSTLDDIVREIYPGLEDAQSALRLPRLKPEGAVEGRLLSWSDIKNLLDANKPFVIAKAGHYWTCYGYEESATVKNLLY